MTDKLDIKEILKSYANDTKFISHQINSYNNFIQFGIYEIVSKEEIKIPMKNGKIYRVTFGDIYVANPVINENQVIRKVFPNEVRQRDLQYESIIYCDITETIEEENRILDTKFHTRMQIAKIPVMVRSAICNLYSLSKEEQIKVGECTLDYGGYFLIKGNERVLVSQMRGNYNTVVVEKRKGLLLAEIRSMSEETNHSISIKVFLQKDEKTIVCTLPYTKEPIPVGIIFRAFGFSDEEIVSLIGLKSEKTKKYISEILRSIYVTDNCKEKSLIYIARNSIKVVPKEKQISYALQILEMELFPHLGVNSTTKAKGMYLGYVISKLLNTRLGIRSEDDKDNYSNKRIETAGILCYDLFNSLFKRYILFIRTNFEKKQDNFNVINVIHNLNIITVGLKHSFSTGNWGVKKNAYIRTGVSQILCRLTYNAVTSHLRRVVIPLGKKGTNLKIRQVHTSHFGLICPCETPEGETAGTVLNLAMTADITYKIPTVLILSIIETELKPFYTSILFLHIEEIPSATKIFLNGMILGITEVPKKFVELFRNLRKIGFIHYMVSVVYDEIDNEIRIFSDAGRGIRPLFTVTNGKQLNITPKDGTDWQTLLYEGKVEYVDISEIEGSVIGMYYNKPCEYSVDYYEIHPIVILGTVAGCILFPDHSQAPRNTYQSNMGKQALGTYSLASKLRTDTIAYSLWYPQKPLVSTLYSELTNGDKMSSGMSCVVMIGCYTGFNQEDSIILNRNSIQRGLFVITSERTITDSERKNRTGITEKIQIPPITRLDKKIGDPEYFQRKHDNYSFLDEKGVAKKGFYVSKGDVIIGKVIEKEVKTIFNDRTEKRIELVDCSIAVKSGEEGIVDRVYDTTTTDGCRLVKIIIRQERVPEPGDKLASRSAQKGTCSIIFNQEDMPFTSDGIIPDIIINSHSQPSRMTINQLMECVLGKTCALSGEYGDATPFGENSVGITPTLCDALAKHGYQRQGYEKMYNGMTGEPINAPIFIGPTYYQRLKHLVKNKMHARSIGQDTQLTRQPLEGRSKDGGLRFGEMERDAIISHGASAFLRERLFTCSDAFQVSICDKCGQVSKSPRDCKICGHDSLSLVNLPYAGKLLFQQLQTMCIKINLKSE